MPLYRLEEHPGEEGLGGLVLPLDDQPGFPEPFAGVLEGNLLAPDPPALPTRIPAARLIAWSGTLAEDGLFKRDPRTWMPAGLDAFRRVCEFLDPLLRRAGVRLLFRTHARHVLCDPQRCLTIASEWRESGAPFALALDPVAMLEAPMIDAADDHLARAFESLAPLAEAVVLANVDPPPLSSDGDDEPDPLRAAPLHRGALDPGVITELWRQHFSQNAPTILLAENIDAQRRALEAGGG